MARLVFPLSGFILVVGRHAVFLGNARQVVEVVGRRPAPMLRYVLFIRRFIRYSIRVCASTSKHGCRRRPLKKRPELSVIGVSWHADEMSGGQCSSVSGKPHLTGGRGGAAVTDAGGLITQQPWPAAGPKRFSRSLDQYRPR